MSDISSSADRAPLERLAEEFVARYRAGEHPALSEYTVRHPELAEQIKELFPALVLMEQLKPADNTGSFNGEPLGPEGLPLEKLGDYRILREIGRGGMGVVYEAEQISLGRHVALKILTARARLEPRHLARFEREAKAAARLHHTNIVPVYGVGSDGGLHYYVMQYIPGMGLDLVLAEMRKLHPKGPAPDPHVHSVEDLARALSSDKALSAAALPGQTEPSNRSDSGRAYWQSVARIGVQVAEALHYAHQQGILHRDIKPSNLLLDGLGSVWVTDFGLAKAQDSEDLTHTGDVVGTLRYLPPERFNGQGDARSDLYGLGLTLYELLALRPAFDAADRNQLIRQVTDADPPRLRKVVPGLPRDLETIVHKAISRDPNDRYANGQEMAADLRRFLEDRPIKARRISSVERFTRWCRRNPVLAGVGSCAAIQLLAVAVVSTVLAFNIAASRDAAVQAKLQGDRDKTDLEKAADDLRDKQHKLETAADQQSLLLGQQYVANGVRSLDAGDYGAAALWFAEGLDKDGANPERAAVHRKRLSNTLRACPRPLHVWFHDGKVEWSEYSPNGRLVCTSAGRSVNLWDGASGKLAVEPLLHEGQVLTIFFSRSGDRLTTGSLTEAGEKTQEYFVRVWDVKTGKPLTPPLRSRTWPGRGSVSQDAGRVVVSADGRSFQVWDVAAGKFLGQPTALPAKDGTLKRLQLSPDGRQVLTTVSTGENPRPRQPANVSSSLTLWDAASGEPVAAPHPIKGFVMSTGYSKDGSRVFVEGDGCIEACDAATGRSLWSRELNQATNCWFSPDDNLVFLVTSFFLSGEKDSREVLDSRTGKAIAGGERIPWDRLIGSFSPNGRFCAIPNNDGLVYVWDLKNMAAVGLPIRHDKNVTGVLPIISPDGQRLLLVGDDNSARVWDVFSATPLTPLLKHAGPVTEGSFSPDGSRVNTVSGNTVRVWPLTTPPLGHVLAAETQSRTKVVRSPDGRLILLCEGDDDDGVYVSRHWLFQRDGGRVSLEPPESSVGPLYLSYSFSSDASYLLGVGHDLTGGLAGEDLMLLWETATGKLRAMTRPARNFSAWFTLKGDHVVVGRGSEIRLMDVGSGTFVTPWGERSRDGKSGPFSPDGDRVLFSASPDYADGYKGESPFSADRRYVLRRSGNAYQRRDVETGQPAGALMRFADDDTQDTTGERWRAAFSADGTRVWGSVTSRQGETFRVWDAATGKPLTPLLPHPLGTNTAALSPNGLLLLTADHGGTVRVWDVATGGLAVPPLMHPNTVSARFSADGRYILTSSPLSSVNSTQGSFSMIAELRVWETATGQPLMPPLRCLPDSAAFTSTAGFDAEGKTVVRLRPDGVLEWTDLTAEDRPDEELRAFAEALSGRRINRTGSPQALEDGPFRAVWSRFEGRAWPESARALLDPIHWHRHEARLALSHYGFGEPTHAVAEWHLNRLLEAAPDDRQALAERAMLGVWRKRWSEAVSDYTAAIDAGAPLWYERGQAYAWMNQWKEAEADFARAARDEPAKKWLCLEALALVRLRNGDEAGWRDVCKQMSADPGIRAVHPDKQLIKAFTAGPDAVRDWTFFVDLGKLDPNAANLPALVKPDEDVRVLAAVLLRKGGSDEQVLRCLPESGAVLEPVRVNPAAVQFIRALAQQRLKQPDNAAESLKKGRALLKAARLQERFHNYHPHVAWWEQWKELVYAEVLEREAAKMIEGK